MDVRHNTRKTWGEIWDLQDAKARFERWIKREAKSVRFEKIRIYIEKYYRSFLGLKAIEVGAGMGVYSLLFRCLGADVTILDINQNALDKAKSLFAEKGVTATFLKKDAFDLDNESLNSFDIAMSFGFVEHFKYPDRGNLVRLHYDLLKPGGILAVSVPNLLFFPHEIMKTFLRIRKKWRLGYERSFSRIELQHLAKKLNLKNWKIIGSSFTYDFKRYIEEYRMSSMGERFFGPAPRGYVKENFLEKKNVFDDYLGADIVLLGIK